MPKPKVLLIHNYYQNPGGESAVFETEIKGLRNMGHEVVVYTRHNAEISHYGLWEKLVMFVQSFDSRRTRRELEALIQHERPQIAIVQNVFPLISPTVYRCLQESRVPVIQAVYNYRLICPAGELYTQGAICERCLQGSLFNCIRHRCYRNSYIQSLWYALIIHYHQRIGTFQRNINLFMVPDHFLGKKLLLGGLGAGKICHNPNPFFVSPNEINEKHAGYFLYIGRFTRQKGIPTLLQAMELADKQVHLKLVGKGEYQKQIEEMLSTPKLWGRAEIMGPLWRDDLDRQLKDCIAVIIPSEWYDNLPLVLCQANAAGKPVLASNIDGIPEYVQEGKNGFLFPPGDAAALAGLMERILCLTTQEYASLARSSRAFAELELDYGVHYQRLQEMFSELLGQQEAV